MANFEWALWQKCSFTKKKKKKVSYRNELFHAHPSVQINTPALSPPLYSGLIWHSFHHVFSHKISFMSLRLKHKFCNLHIRSCFSEQSTHFWSSPNHFFFSQFDRYGLAQISLLSLTWISTTTPSHFSSLRTNVLEVWFLLRHN